MLQEISKITGLPFNHTDAASLFLLRRIERKLPIQVNVDLLDRNFIAEVKKAAAEVEKEGPLAETVPQPEGPRVLKIKSSPKGARIKVAAPNGIRYSFGPVWNESVIKGKGIATAEAHQEKLQFQAEMLGIQKPFPENVVDLCALMAPLLKQQEAA